MGRPRMSPWLTANLNAGMVTATVSTGDLSVGQTETGTVRVESNGGDAVVTVELTVTEPKPMVTVSFTCENGQTYLGQSVYVVGSSPELGTWEPENAAKLEPKDYPTWTGEIDLPANADYEWKCLKREEANPRAGVVWQPGENNTLCTSPSCPQEVNGGF